MAHSWPLAVLLTIQAQGHARSFVATASRTSIGRLVAFFSPICTAGPSSIQHGRPSFRRQYSDLRDLLIRLILFDLRGHGFRRDPDPFRIVHDAQNANEFVFPVNALFFAADAAFTHRF